MLRILVVDDHPIVRVGIRNLIGTRSEWAVCGEADDGVAGLEAALNNAPDIVVLEVGLPLLNGIAVTRQLKRQRPETSVLMFTAYEDDESINAGLAAGARGFVLKSDTADDLEPAISALGAGRTYFSARVTELLMDAMQRPRARSPLEQFTPRELQVAQLMAESCSNKQISRALGITLKTVETHRSSLMNKSGCHRIGEFTRFACRYKLISARRSSI
ncbi:response regulator transcription factor [Phenylobacterium sp. LjRoot219]|uniref:response regulator n=1 Tax=Phenylobacterium sp. LjRoot219 TaxID=3342283 RepID=UPI003ECC4BE2